MTRNCRRACCISLLWQASLQGKYCILVSVPPLLPVVAASASNLKAVLSSSAEHTELTNNHMANY